MGTTEESQVNEAKSILDGMAIKSTWCGVQSAPPKSFTVVGACHKCGAPIYGQAMVMQGDPISLQFSCHCNAGVCEVGITRTT